MFRATGRVLRGAAVAVAALLTYCLGVDGEDGDVTVAATGGDPARTLAAATRDGLDRPAVERLLHSLGDRWARYRSPEEYADYLDRLNGRYGGVGLWLDGAGDRVRVTGVRPGSAAARAGVRGGDTVTAVDGTPVAGWDVTRVARALRGAPGTGVTLAVERRRQELRFPLVRTELADPSVTSRDLPGELRSVRVRDFTRGTGRRVRQAVLAAQGRRAGLLLDLRGNPGGLLEEAVATASAFLGGGPVLTFERPGAPPRPFAVTRPGDAETPLVVLVDGDTASAAEAVAGALRARDRAKIIGSRTHGKAAVQESVRLPDGGAVTVTAGRYRTPDGLNLDGVGIDPDVAVAADRPPRAAEQRAREVLRSLVATPHEKD